MSWKASVITLFPETFPGPLGVSIPGRAMENGFWELETVNLREFAIDERGSVDDRPYGGGAGMVIRPDVVESAIKTLNKPEKIVYVTPRGKVLNQQKIDELTSLNHVAFLSGRYEGIDQRVIEHYDMDEISVGDYVLSGGEIPIMTIIDACVRRLSGVLEKPDAAENESFAPGTFAHLLEYPHYTRPENWQGASVPSVLLSGHHEEILKWRIAEAEKITEARRPDLWKQYKK